MVRIQEDPIEPAAVLSLVRDPGCGGTALFLGTVRDHAAGRNVRSMRYDAYLPMAEERMREIESQVRARWPARQVALVHRVGDLGLTEVSVAVAVAAPHRADAFEACRYAIDRLKETVPIWKKEYGDGGAVWVEGGSRRPAGDA